MIFLHRQDVEIANQQIEILRTLGIDQLLRPENPRYASTQDLRIILIGELIFPERSSAVESISRIKQIVSMGNYGVSDKQINEIYTKPHPASIYWVLLTREAHEAGVRTPIEPTKAQLEMISSNVKCALSFEDAKDANAVLDTLKNQNCIAFAGIYDCNGNLFSSYCRDDVRNKVFKLVPPTKAKFVSRNGYMVVSEPVIHQKQFLGTVCLWTQI